MSETEKEVKQKIRGLNNLTQLKINTLLKPWAAINNAPTKMGPKKEGPPERKAERHGDGGGLYLQITTEGTPSWLFRYQMKGKSRAMGLGALHLVNLADARKAAHACRVQVEKGIDPLEAKKQQRHAQLIEDASVITFKQCATAYHLAHKDGWKNAKHASQWTNTLKTYAYPVIGDLSVAAVDVALITKILEPIWKTKTETASRLRGRIESVIDWATANGYRTGENPARWKGHLDHLLLSRSAAHKVEHHSALPYSEIGDFVRMLKKQEGIAQYALEFVILTASRTSEAINMTFSEIEFDSKTWIIPGERMKAGREHRVPLSDRAVEILRHMESLAQHKFVFPGRIFNKPLSNMALLQLLRRMERGDLTVHGFRATFRTWAGECTHYPRETLEAALAHTLKDKTEAAYARGDLFEKRRHLMNDWAAYCNTPSQAGNVNITGPSADVACA